MKPDLRPVKPKAALLNLLPNFIFLKQSTSIRIKALILLAVFSLNTVIGFACSVGVDMNFNSKHHHDNGVSKSSVHIHKDGKAHEHKAEGKAHSHDKKAHSHTDQKDNCCKDEVQKFQSLDKSVKPVTTVNAPVFPFTAVVPFYTSQLIASSFAKADKYVIPNSHPPPTAIYIFVQSFRI